MTCCDVDGCTKEARVMVEPGVRLCREHDRLWPKAQPPADGPGPVDGSWP